jgi:hypothetical protein
MTQCSDVVEYQHFGALFWIAASDSAWDPSMEIFNFGSIKKSHGNKYGKHGKCSNTGICFWAKIYITKAATREGALM